MIEFINIDNYEDFERASDYAREMNKPIFVEADGHELVLMTAELFEEMFGELYADMEKIEVVLDEAEEDVMNGNTAPMKDTFDDIRNTLAEKKDFDVLELVDDEG